MRRRKWTKAKLLEVREEQGGMCYLCQQPLDDDPALGPTEADHILPLALGGADELHNIMLAHRECHRGRDSKTTEDRKRIAKADRCKRYQETGRGRARKGKPLQGRGFNKKLRRKIDGTVVKS